jgi:preprotein translocase subunit SecE
MATKTSTIERSDERSAKRQEPNAMQEFSGNAMGKWTEFTRFLSDVRAEMRKVVAPSKKEVQVTTSVVVITVFIFGVFFFLTDLVFRTGMDALLKKLGGMQ